VQGKKKQNDGLQGEGRETSKEEKKKKENRVPLRKQGGAATMRKKIAAFKSQRRGLSRKNSWPAVNARPRNKTRGAYENMEGGGKGVVPRNSD